MKAEPAAGTVKLKNLEALIDDNHNVTAESGLPEPRVGDRAGITRWPSPMHLRLRIESYTSAYR